MMRKLWRTTLWLLIFVILLSLPVFAAEDGGAGSLTFFVSGTPTNFKDVSSKSWYYANVREMTALGLMQGVGKDRFAPEENMEVAEAVALAARVHAVYTYASTDPVESLPVGKQWYDRYYDYLLSQGISSVAGWRNKAAEDAPRELVATLFARIILPKDLQEINVIYNLPDCSVATESLLLPLYKAGVLTGDDAFGSFLPDTPIKRSETAALCTRLVRPKMRVKCRFVPSGVGAEINFSDIAGYDNRFKDVSKKSWYYDNVAICFNKGLMQGVSKQKFAPDSNITLAEVATAAARFHCIWLTGNTEMLDAFPKGSQWYGRYYSYLKAANLLPASYEKTPNAAATREQAVGLFAVIVYDDLKVINSVSAIPDYTGTYAKQVLHLYKAGVISGKDDYGTFGASDPVKRSEMAALLSRMAETSLRKEFTLKKAVSEWFSYGKSGAGRTLGGWKLGNGDKALVLTFAIHGWEDNWARDGWALVNTANALIDELKADLIANPAALGNWTVYVLPMCNPDGLLDGTSCNGPGRRTVWNYDANGKLVKKGIDLNRSFPSGYTKLTSDRNYNGTAPLAAPEARALDSFLKQVAQKHTTRYFVDVHGWYDQIISHANETLLRNAFTTYFPSIRPTPMGSGGYLCAYATHALGYHAALFEFPNVSSASEFERRNFEGKFISSIKYILKR